MDIKLQPSINKIIVAKNPNSDNLLEWAFFVNVS